MLQYQWYNDTTKHEWQVPVHTLQINVDKQWGVQLTNEGPYIGKHPTQGDSYEGNDDGNSWSK